LATKSEFFQDSGVHSPEAVEAGGGAVETANRVAERLIEWKGYKK